MAKISNLHGEDSQDDNVIPDFSLKSDGSIVIGIIVGECWVNI